MTNLFQNTQQLPSIAGRNFTGQQYAVQQNLAQQLANSQNRPQVGLPQNAPQNANPFLSLNSAASKYYPHQSATEL